MADTKRFLDHVAAPARRALLRAGLTTLEQIAKKTEDEIAALHGIGQNTLDLIKMKLQDSGLTFRKKSK